MSVCHTTYYCLSFALLPSFSLSFSEASIERCAFGVFSAGTRNENDGSKKKVYMSAGAYCGDIQAMVPEEGDGVGLRMG